ncbi:MAG: Rpn family recombination-promoting nuclease/putative transposase [Bacilli bacterium]|nr:Rpn family recombination-promoting nuclease/putative transposase [Bacilli bacterium]
MNKEKLQYYQKLDTINKECGKTMIKLTFDTAFKSFFSRNPDFLKDFLIEELSLDMDKGETKITVSNVELPKDIQKEYQKKVDIIIYLDESIIVNVEANTNKFKNIKRRNFIYMAKLYGLTLKKGEDVKKLEEADLYQLNINASKDDKNIGENIYELRSRFTGETLIDNFTLHLKNIEYYRNLYYNKGEKLSRADMWLVVLSSENYEELYRTVSQILDEKDTDIFMDEVIRMNLEEPILTEWEAKMLDEIEKYDTIKNSKEEGFVDGFEEGENSGIQKNKIETARKMLDEKLDINLISKITGMSKEEIEKLT